MVHREPLASATESGHHFVGNQKDAVLVAQSAQPLHVAVWRYEYPVSPNNRLDNDRSDRIRSFELNNFFGAREYFLSSLCFLVDAVIKLRNTKDSGNPRLGGPAARIAGQRERPGGAAVIRAIARADFVTSGEQTRDADGVLVRFGATVGKEKRI